MKESSAIQRKSATEKTALLPHAETLEGEQGLTHRTIGALGGFALLINNTTGPGMVQLPLLWQTSGWVVPTCMICLCGVLTVVASSLLTEAMAMMPGNERLQRRMEMTTVAEYYFDKKGFHMTVVLFLLCLQATNISSIIVSSQIMDLALIGIARTCALQLYPSPALVCVAEQGTDISPFGASSIVVSAGFLIILVIAIPLGYINLDDNIGVQIFAFFAMIALIAEWFVVFFIVGMDVTSVPMFGTMPNTISALGTIFFNYAAVITVPSWLNEKRAHVSINKTLVGGTITASLLYLTIGFFGSWAFRISNDQDILDVLAGTTGLPVWLHATSQICVYIFPMVTLVSSIPVASIIIRYNLVESRLCSRGWANFWAVVFPWLFAVPFYTGNGLSSIIAWAGIVVNGTVNFTLPLLLYVYARRERSSQQRKIPQKYTSHFFDAESTGDASSWGVLEPYSAFAPWVLSRLPQWLTALKIAWTLLSLSIALTGTVLCASLVYTIMGVNFVS